MYLICIDNDMSSHLKDKYVSVLWARRMLGDVRYYLAVNCVAENDWYVACSVLNFGKMWSCLCRLWGMGYAMVP
jgi:hypothetical protein